MKRLLLSILFVIISQSLNNKTPIDSVPTLLITYEVYFIPESGGYLSYFLEHDSLTKCQALDLIKGTLPKCDYTKLEIRDWKDIENNLKQY